MLTDLDHAQLALGQVGDLDLLDSHSLAGAPIESLVDGTEGAFADAVAESLRIVMLGVSKIPCEYRVGEMVTQRT